MLTSVNMLCVLCMYVIQCTPGHSVCVCVCVSVCVSVHMWTLTYSVCVCVCVCLYTCGR